MNAEARRSSSPRVLLAWGVHLLTASGVVMAALALLAVMRRDYAATSLLLLAALFVDSVDGTLARRVGVSTLVPRIDGRRLDDIVDYVCYALVPTVFLLAIGALPHWAWSAVPLLSSAYGFSQRDAKTADDFFLGWPSYWNVVAIYAWLLQLSAWTVTGFVVVFALAVFVPLKYVYPSRLRVWRTATIGLACAWGLLLVAAILVSDPAWSLGLGWTSLFFPVYYLLLSARLGRWLRRAD